jgi:hypothetical protein
LKQYETYIHACTFAFVIVCRYEHAAKNIAKRKVTDYQNVK